MTAERAEGYIDARMLRGWELERKQQLRREWDTFMMKVLRVYASNTVYRPNLPKP